MYNIFNLRLLVNSIFAKKNSKYLKKKEKKLQSLKICKRAK